MAIRLANICQFTVMYCDCLYQLSILLRIPKEIYPACVTLMTLTSKIAIFLIPQNKRMHVFRSKNPNSSVDNSFHSDSICVDNAKPCGRGWDLESGNLRWIHNDWAD